VNYKILSFQGGRARQFIHWTGMLSILAVELIWLSIRYDAANLGEIAPGLLSITILSKAGDLFKIGAVFLALALIISGPRMVVHLKELKEKENRYWWLLLHGVSFLVFIKFTDLIYDHSKTAYSLYILHDIGWLTSGFTMLAFWMMACIPLHTCLIIIRRETTRLIFSLIIAVAAWALSFQAQFLWNFLAQGTLTLSHFILSILYTDLIHESGSKILGTSHFQVEIDRQCSGYEGIVLISCFLGVYLWLYRKQLRFPQAFVLFPIGIAVIWFANSLRIVALIAIGNSFSPEIAVSGFHSQAGWITFITVAFGLVAFTHWAGLFTAKKAYPATGSHGQLATALLVPFLVLMASTLLTRAFIVDFNYFYPLVVAVAALSLWYYRHHYAFLSFTWSYSSIGIGILVFVVWTALEPEPTGSANELAQSFAELPPGLAVVWVIFRLIGFVLVVPIVEELVFRGYLLRKLAAWDFDNVPVGHFTWLSFIGSSLLFGLLHDLWLAGTLAGAGYALAVYKRGQIGDAIIAHATTNAMLAIFQ
jgi:exosortase E/protease (VPEID-CTERM system)